MSDRAATLAECPWTDLITCFICPPILISEIRNRGFCLLLSIATSITPSALSLNFFIITVRATFSTATHPARSV